MTKVDAMTTSSILSILLKAFEWQGTACVPDGIRQPDSTETGNKVARR